jgi:two-component system NarL family response regulator
MNPIKVLLVIEVQLIGNIFASVLEDEADFEVAGCVPTLRQALEFIQTQPVAIVLVSAGLPGNDALDLTRSITECAPSARIVILGLSEKHQGDTLRYIEAGAAGYILKDSSLHDFLEILRLASKGEARVSPRMAGAMMERLSSLARMFSRFENKVSGDVRLTSRELEVLQFIGQGLTNQEIASRLVVEVGTVKNHVHRILEKLNVSSRDEAASYLAFIRK